MCNNITLSQEEKFIKLIDKYITQHRDHTINAVFYRKLYVLFVGYHLKYYYSSKQYCNSCFHVDNIMQMFTGVVSSLKANVLTKLNNSNIMLHCLNGLVDYISANLMEVEQLYADLLAQYERKSISHSLDFIPPPMGGRKRL
ncbi:hypothetical protein [Klebsiella pneumoniae]|uniref:hypothetical protein n=1 Tax=Klebsiella pneumoniae TaxID=573 RepID=UPI000E2E1827|nr:hypothetical protein [Klebsiella pneumoniae]HDU5600634.1 hypothetical protein [Klebsiella pneumoniae subsp. ozaenae]MBC5403423.1 hypothetical protein [Klebsiella pneumoniae]MCE7446513.1 hypothetical protein [Klebsiella pneumoniae]SVR25247.1 Uncharacterised protein [Klebsiella pneumoniae]HBQ9156746.1 hypothetical protein [Klebsiella pneumoniae]